jgi:hypothetical protein
LYQSLLFNFNLPRYTLAIQAAPENIPTTLRQRAMLADEMCAVAGSGLGLAHISHGGGFEMAAAGWYTVGPYELNAVDP